MSTDTVEVTGTTRLEDRLFDAFAGTAPPERLAVVRIGVFGFGALYLAIFVLVHRSCRSQTSTSDVSRPSAPCRY